MVNRRLDECLAHSIRGKKKAPRGAIFFKSLLFLSTNSDNPFTFAVNGSKIMFVCVIVTSGWNR